MDIFHEIFLMVDRKTYEKFILTNTVDVGLDVIAEVGDIVSFDVISGFYVEHVLSEFKIVCIKTEVSDKTRVSVRLEKTRDVIPV